MIHRHHVFSNLKTGTASTHSKSGIVVYQGGVYTVSEGIIIILLCVTNITASIYKQCKVTDSTSMEEYLGCAHGCIMIWYHTKASGILLYITVILIQTRPAQHMSCSPGLHLWRAHSPPNPSLMRKFIQKLKCSLSTVRLLWTRLYVE